MTWPRDSASAGLTVGLRENDKRENPDGGWVKEVV